MFGAAAVRLEGSLESAAGFLEGFAALEGTDNIAVDLCLLLLSLAVCFFGYRLIKVWAAAVGALVGFLLSFPVGGMVQGWAGAVSDGLSAALGIGVMAGCVLLCAFLSFKVYQLGVFLLCGLVPAVFILLVTWGSAGGQIMAAAAFVGCGVLGVLLTRPCLIALTSVGYGAAAGSLLLGLAGVDDLVLSALAGAVLAALGFLYQWRTTARPKREGEDRQEQAP